MNIYDLHYLCKSKCFLSELYVVKQIELCASSITVNQSKKAKPFFKDTEAMQTLFDRMRIFFWNVDNVWTSFAIHFSTQVTTETRNDYSIEV